MKQYVRKPDPVNAQRITKPEDLVGYEAVARWMVLEDSWQCKTAHGWIDAEFGDWLVTDRKGDWWPVKHDIFVSRYDPISSDQNLYWNPNNTSLDMRTPSPPSHVCDSKDTQLGGAYAFCSVCKKRQR